MTEAGTTVRDEDWDGEKLDHQSFERVTFVDVDMTELANNGSALNEHRHRVTASVGVRYDTEVLYAPAKRLR